MNKTIPAQAVAMAGFTDALEAARANLDVAALSCDVEDTLGPGAAVAVNAHLNAACSHVQLAIVQALRAVNNLEALSA